jgi:hypothetical protein
VTFSATERDWVEAAASVSRAADANERFVVASVETTRTLAAVTFTEMSACCTPRSAAKFRRKSSRENSSTVPASVTDSSTWLAYMVPGAAGGRGGGSARCAVVSVSPSATIATRPIAVADRVANATTPRTMVLRLRVHPTSPFPPPLGGRVALAVIDAYAGTVYRTLAALGLPRGMFSCRSLPSV